MLLHLRTYYCVACMHVFCVCRQLDLGSPDDLDEDVDMSTNEKDIKDMCTDDQDDIIDQDNVDDQDDIDRLYGLDHYDSDDDNDDGIDEKGRVVKWCKMFRNPSY